MNNINEFLKVTRRKQSTIKGRSFEEESLSDRSRVIYSAPFRRLQQKAQVFSLEKNAAVRSRLTHTLEVADTGKGIAQLIADELCLSGILNKENVRPFVTIVETSCFMHDIGNLPFGHFGEEAIKRWFKDNYTELFKLAKVTLPTANSIEDQYLDDFNDFDGNPQGFRIVTHLQTKPGKFSEYGLNLMYSQLGAFLKYTRPAGCKKGIGSHIKKAGYFNSEKHIVKEIEDTLNYKGRHPLVYIMEAADDISYCLSDIEDGIEKGIISAIKFLSEIKKDVLDLRLGLDLVKYFNLNEKSAETDFFHFKIAIHNHLKNYCAKEYVKHIDRFTNDCKQCLISKDAEEGKLLDIIKGVARKILFKSEEAQSIELTGFNVINGLLQEFSKILTLPLGEFDKILRREDKTGHDVEERLFAKLPNKYIEAYEYCRNNNPDNVNADFLELHARIHLVLDFISGMTDIYSLTLHRQLKGIDF